MTDLYIIVPELYGGLRNDLCNDASVSIDNCIFESVDDFAKHKLPPPSYIFQSQIFSQLCKIRIVTKLLECYSNVTYSCPYYRDNGPALMNVEAFKAFIIGTCVNRNVLEDGITCMGSKQSDMIAHVNRNCLTYELVEYNVWDVYTDTPGWTWHRYCSLMITGIQCSVNKTQELGCSDEFYDFLLHSSYVRLPIECLEPNSTKFKWLDMYMEIPTMLSESQNKIDREEPNTTIDNIVSSATCNNMSHFSVIALNLISLAVSSRK
ncbi:unnamed protein product [Mytilus coruscus]|uniref:Uncharacterized protein n=1 Tax=Mytilus coruscus TaxID=42192 RepID=A0A6J8CN15_MYTCO|nr:unnamed protein product [Mytilus coruscus]